MKQILIHVTGGLQACLEAVDMVLCEIIQLVFLPKMSDNAFSLYLHTNDVPARHTKFSATIVPVIELEHLGRRALCLFRLFQILLVEEQHLMVTLPSTDCIPFDFGQDEPRDIELLHHAEACTIF